jgi:hypothetical protein
VHLLGRFALLLSCTQRLNDGSLSGELLVSRLLELRRTGLLTHLISGEELLLVLRPVQLLTVARAQLSLVNGAVVHVVQH